MERNSGSASIALIHQLQLKSTSLHDITSLGRLYSLGCSGCVVFILILFRNKARRRESQGQMNVNITQLCLEGHVNSYVLEVKFEHCSRVLTLKFSRMHDDVGAQSHCLSNS
jgi:hypothetical protein